MDIKAEYRRLQSSKTEDLIMAAVCLLLALLWSLGVALLKLPELPGYVPALGLVLALLDYFQRRKQIKELMA